MKIPHSPRQAAPNSARRAEAGWRQKLPAGGAKCVVGIAVDDHWTPEKGKSELELADAVLDAGGEPRLLLAARGPIAQQMDGVDALLLPGGRDVDPREYGQSAGPAMRRSKLDPDFDDFEMGCARRAYDRKMPMLGICRGMQVMNVAGGGSLVQDIPTQWPSPENHSVADTSKLAHLIAVSPSSRLARTLGRTLEAVNSHHHQCLLAVSPLLAPVAWALDGVVEGVERPGVPGERGVQFHPEDLRERLPEDQKFFRELVQDGQRYRAGAAPSESRLVNLTA